MGNMVTNVCAKSNYDRLRIDKALGFRKYDNKKNENINNKSKNNVHSDWGPLRSDWGPLRSGSDNILGLQEAQLSHMSAIGRSFR